MFNEAKDKSFWLRIRTEDKYQGVRDYLLEQYNQYCTGPIVILDYSKFKLFNITGSRKEYEDLYFCRRGRLNTLAALSLIFEEEKYISELEDIIWEICNEFTWALPAHISMCTLEEARVYVDLFAAETGMALSEILYLLSDKLSDFVKERIKSEVNRRIIDSFEATTFLWETINNNWAAVCGGSVAATYMYMAPEKFEDIYPRINKTMDCFLSSFEEDGACREGYSYWNYGFGFFTVYGSLLKDFTNGKRDVFKNPKVKEIAKFQERVYMQENIITTFADTAVGNYKFLPGITSYLKKTYGDEFTIPPIENAAKIADDPCHRWAHFIRNLVWELPETSGEIKKETIYFPYSEIYINRKDKFAFAIKGGNNDEPHNHNDIGSFIFARDNQQIFADFGMGEYTRQYFDPATRYSFLVNSSRGHNVPIINGQLQKQGEEYKATVINADEDVFEVEFAKAYDLPELKSLVRKCVISSDGVTITDTFTFSETPSSVIERFVSWIKPEIKDGLVKIDNAALKFDPNKFDCTFAEEIYSDHYAQPKAVYLIDLIPKHLKSNMVCEYTIE